MKIRFFLKHTVLVLIFALGLISGALWAQEAKAFVGDWNGVAYVEGTEVIRIICHFKLNKNGNLTGTADSPSQEAFDIPLANIKVEGKTISFGVDDPNVTGDPQFKGTLDETGTKISGVFSQHGTEGTIEFTRDTKVTRS
jgi:hypothetical protein